MQKKLNDKQKILSYVLTQDPDLNCTQKKVGELFGVRQSTISNAVKEIKFRTTIHDLSKQLAEAKEEALSFGIVKPAGYLPNSISENIVDVTPKNRRSKKPPQVELS